MKTLYYVILALLLSASCSAQKLTEAGEVNDRNVSIQLTENYPAIMLLPVKNDFFEMDANNNPVRSENLNDLLPINRSDPQYNTLERMKKFPENKIRTMDNLTQKNNSGKVTSFKK